MMPASMSIDLRIATTATLDDFIAEDIQHFFSGSEA
jgi:hypothetical protein